MKYIFIIITGLFLFTTTSYAVVIKDIKVNNNKRITKNTIITYGDIQLNKDYNQNELKIGGRPLLQASLFMKKKNFNIGVLVENIHSLFFDELYIIPDYIYTDLVFRLSLDWRFLD